MRSKALLLIALMATTAAMAAMAACSSYSAPTPTATPTPAATPAVTPPPEATEATKEGEVSSDIVNFTLQDLVVSVGTAITWVNRDSASHTSTAIAGSALPWDSDRLRTGGSFTFTFNEPGTYQYFCTIHPSMKGTVTVNR